MVSVCMHDVFHRHVGVETVRVRVSGRRLRDVYLRTPEQRERLEAEDVPPEIGPALRLARHPLLEHLGRA